MWYFPAIGFTISPICSPHQQCIIIPIRSELSGSWCLLAGSESSLTCPTLSLTWGHADGYFSFLERWYKMTPLSIDRNLCFEIYHTGDCWWLAGENSGWIWPGKNNYGRLWCIFNLLPIKVKEEDTLTVFLEEQFMVPPWEPLCILKEGDLLRVTLSQGAKEQISSSLILSFCRRLQHPWTTTCQKAETGDWDRWQKESKSREPNNESWPEEESSG